MTRTKNIYGQLRFKVRPDTLGVTPVEEDEMLAWGVDGPVTVGGHRCFGTVREAQGYIIGVCAAEIRRYVGVMEATTAARDHCDEIVPRLGEGEIDDG